MSNNSICICVYRQFNNKQHIKSLKTYFQHFTFSKFECYCFNIELTNKKLDYRPEIMEISKYFQKIYNAKDFSDATAMSHSYDELNESKRKSHGQDRISHIVLMARLLEPLVNKQEKNPLILVRKLLSNRLTKFINVLRNKFVPKQIEDIDNDDDGDHGDDDDDDDDDYKDDNYVCDKKHDHNDEEDDDDVDDDNEEIKDENARAKKMRFDDEFDSKEKDFITILQPLVNNDPPPSCTYVSLSGPCRVHILKDEFIMGLFTNHPLPVHIMCIIGLDPYMHVLFMILLKLHETMKSLTLLLPSYYTFRSTTNKKSGIRYDWIIFLWLECLTFFL